MALLGAKSDKKGIIQALLRKEYPDKHGLMALIERLKTLKDLSIDDGLALLRAPAQESRNLGVALLKAKKDPRAIDLIIEAGKSSPDALRRFFTAVVHQLAIAGTGDKLALYFANEKDQAAARFAAEVLLAGPLTPAVALKLKAHKDPALRMRVVSRLSEQGNATALVEMLSDEDERVRVAAASALEPIATSQHMSAIVGQMSTDGIAVVSALTKTLASIARREGRNIATQVVPLIAHGDTGVRSAALDVIRVLPNKEQVIRDVLLHTRDLTGWIRERVLEGLLSFGDELVRPVLAVLEGADDEMRASCLALATRLSTPEVVPHVIRALEDPDWWVRTAAVDALARLRDPRAVPHLVGMLGDEEGRWAAIEALAEIGDAASLQHVVNLLRSPDAAVRREVIKSIERFNPGGKPGAKLLEIIKRFASTDADEGVRAAALECYRALSARQAAPIDTTFESNVRSTIGAASNIPLYRCLTEMRARGASDVHVSVGSPLIARIDGELTTLGTQPLDDNGSWTLIGQALTPEQRAYADQHHQLDFCLEVPGDGRYRASVFLDRRGYNAVFRVVPREVPTISDIGLPPHLTVISKMNQGLVIVSGTSGSGKSTTLAALVNLINDTRSDHVLTLEDPIEFVHTPKNSLINQREVPRHTQSFARALRAALREDPDVIMIGEMRDLETVQLALTAAETGHIVFGTLNTTSAAKSVDRIINSFPADQQPQVRAMLSESLKVAICQKLLPRAGGGRVAAFEILMGNLSLANLIRENKTYQIPSLMQVGRAIGNIRFDDSLREHLEARTISPETAYLAADNKADFEALVPAEALAAFTAIE